MSKTIVKVEFQHGSTALTGEDILKLSVHSQLTLSLSTKSMSYEFGVSNLTLVTITDYNFICTLAVNHNIFLHVPFGIRRVMLREVVSRIPVSLSVSVMVHVSKEGLINVVGKETDRREWTFAIAISRFSSHGFSFENPLPTLINLHY